MGDMDEAYAELARIKRERKKKKRSINRISFNKMLKKYNFIIHKEVNNIITFEYNNIIYYFTEINGKYREKGSKISTGIAGIIKEEKSKDIKYTLKFGKYKGETLETIFKKDLNYLNWIIEQEWVDKTLKDRIKNYINEQKIK